MDENDKNILRHLMEDGRKSNVDIADAIGVSEETVRRRRAGLQRDGVYEMVAVPDYRKLGYGVEMLLGIEADSSQTDEVAEALSEVDEVYRVSCTRPLTGLASFTSSLPTKPRVGVFLGE